MDRSTWLVGRPGIPEEEIKSRYRKALPAFIISGILGIILLIWGVLWDEMQMIIPAVIGLVVLIMVILSYFFYQKK